MKEIDNLLKPRNGLDKMSLWEMCDFLPYKHGLGCANSLAMGTLVSQTQTVCSPKSSGPGRRRDEQDLGRKDGLVQAWSPPLPHCLGTAHVGQGRRSLLVSRRRLAAEETGTQCYLLITTCEEKTHHLTKP